MYVLCFKVNVMEVEHNEEEVLKIVEKITHDLNKFINENYSKVPIVSILGALSVLTVYYYRMIKVLGYGYEHDFAYKSIAYIIAYTMGNYNE